MPKIKWNVSKTKSVSGHWPYREVTDQKQQNYFLFEFLHFSGKKHTQSILMNYQNISILHPIQANRMFAQIWRQIRQKHSKTFIDTLDNGFFKIP